jgi:hypothetical protein
VGASASIAIDPAQREAAASAARWLPAFYSHVTLTLDDRVVKLRSDHCSDTALAAIWAAALANEALLVRGRADREAGLAALAR